MFAVGEIYEALGIIAKKSFEAFHPDVDLFYITNENIKDFKYYDKLEEFGLGYGKFFYANEIMQTYKYEKIILLGADTITCARLDEFIDNNKSDMIGTLDYNIGLEYRENPSQKPLDFYTPMHSLNTANFKIGTLWMSPTELKALTHIDPPQVSIDYIDASEQKKQLIVRAPSHLTFGDLERASQSKDFSYAIPIGATQFNADVICFNGKKMLQDITYTCENGLIPRTNFNEQMIINMFAWWEGHAKLRNIRTDYQPHTRLSAFNDWWNNREPYKVVMADGPWPSSTVSYNVRSKNHNLHSHPPPGAPDRLPYWHRKTSTFYVEEEKLFVPFSGEDEPCFIFYSGLPTPDKQIKVWHYCDSFGSGLKGLVDSGTRAPAAEKIINQYIHLLFNEDTKKFFKEQCNSGDFFEKEFKIK